MRSRPRRIAGGEPRRHGSPKRTAAQGKSRRSLEEWRHSITAEGTGLEPAAGYPAPHCQCFGVRDATTCYRLAMFFGRFCSFVGVDSSACLSCYGPRHCISGVKWWASVSRSFLGGRWEARHDGGGRPGAREPRCPAGVAVEMYGNTLSHQVRSRRVHSVEKSSAGHRLVAAVSTHYVAISCAIGRMAAHTLAPRSMDYFVTTSHT